MAASAPNPPELAAPPKPLPKVEPPPPKADPVLGAGAAKAEVVGKAELPP